MRMASRQGANTIRAVIFDMDGVLIDSEPVYQKHIYEGFVVKYPWITREDLYPMAGMSGTEDKIFLAKLMRRDASDPDFLKEIEENYAGCQVHYPDIMRPQVPALLQTLHDMGLKVALASSSSGENIATVLTQCGIKKYFDVIVSGYDFQESKPNPEIYLHTMECLDCRAEECLIIEDSDYGIVAGVDAGATVAALRDERFPFDQSRAQFHMDSLDEIPGLLRRGMRKIKAVFFDVDGTLAAMGSHRIPESTRRALSELRERKVRVLLSTGRHALEIEEENILPGLTFDGAVWLNGQLCELDGQVVQKNKIPKDQLKILKKFLETYRCSCIFLEKDIIYCNFVNDRLCREQEKIGTSIPDVRSIEDLEEREILQAIPFIDREEEQELLKLLSGCRITRWGEGVVDLIAESGGKAQGILALCAAMGIGPEEIIAFGDGENDADMLKMAGIGIAMGESVEAAIEAADYVTDGLEQDGIRKALVYFGVIS